MGNQQCFPHLYPAVRTGDHLRVVREEVEPLLGVDHQLAAVVALEVRKNVHLHNIKEKTQIVPKYTV